MLILYMYTHSGEGEASILNKCQTYLVVLETGGLGEAVELGLVGAEAGLGAGGQEQEKICEEQ